MRIETQCLHEGYHPGNGEPSALPIYQSTTYRYDSTEHIGKLFDLTAAGHMYSRISNPTVAAVEEKIAAMEGGVGALCTTSGQAATMISLMNILKEGDHFISTASIYGSNAPLSIRTCPRKTSKKCSNRIRRPYLAKPSQPQPYQFWISKNGQRLRTKTTCR